MVFKKAKSKYLFAGYVQDDVLDPTVAPGALEGNTGVHVWVQKLGDNHY